MNLTFVRCLILFITIKLGKQNSLNEEKFSGVVLKQKENASICRELHFKKLDEFSFCFYVNHSELSIEGVPEGLSLQRSRILTLRDADSFISLHLGTITIDLDINGTVFHYLKKLQYDTWTRICLYREANLFPVRLWMNYREVTELSHEMLNDWNEIKEYASKFSMKEAVYSDIVLDSDSRSLLVSKEGNASLCFHFDLYEKINPHIISIAAVNISHHFTEDVKDVDCTSSLKKEEMIEFSDENWVANNVNHLNLSLFDLCLNGTNIISFVNQSGSRDEHLQLCKYMDGRLIDPEEVEHLEKYFELVRLNITKKFNFFLNGKTEKIGFVDICPSYPLYTNVKFKESCSKHKDFTFCISPSLVECKCYGPLKKYGRIFFLTKFELHNFKLYEQFGCIEKKQQKWVLSSIFHTETLELESTIPMGRHNWTSKNGKNYTLTITHCKEKEFACTNGTCLPWNVRCNGTVECLDKSDEENCNQLEKELGYNTDLLPPPNKGESTFKLYFGVILVSIADILSKESTINMDIKINLTWYDPRITFWNIAANEIINIKNIWSPELRFEGSYPPGTLIEKDEKKISTSCKSHPDSFKTNKTRKFSESDPFMGTYISGEDMKILYMFESVMKVPCSFDLHNYPFGNQSCNIAFRVENIGHSSNLKFVFDGNATNTSEVIYQGNKKLGEFYFTSADHKVDDVKGVVVVSIYLVNLYGFHIINTFIPSVLICIIAYSTLYFPIKDHSDRVMLSLTALLVLAALFTQSSNTSVITPYYKLIDIWYVVLIFYCFMIVVFNIFLRKFASIEERRSRNTLLNPNEENLDEDCGFKSETPNQWKKKLVFCNIIAIIFFSVFYILFIFYFCLDAADII